MYEGYTNTFDVSYPAQKLNDISWNGGFSPHRSEDLKEGRNYVVQYTIVIIVIITVSITLCHPTKFGISSK